MDPSRKPKLMVGIAIVLMLIKKQQTKLMAWDFSQDLTLKFLTLYSSFNYLLILGPTCILFSILLSLLFQARLLLSILFSKLFFISELQLFFNSPFAFFTNLISFIN